MIENAPILAPKKANKLGKNKISLLGYTWISSMVNDSTSLNHLMTISDQNMNLKKDLPPDKTYGVVVDVIIDEEVVVEPVPVTPPAEVTPLAVLALFPFPEVVDTPGSNVIVLPVPVWLAVWALLFEFPLLFDPVDEGILVVTKEKKIFTFFPIIYDGLGFSLELTWLGKLEIIDNIVTSHYF